MASPKTKQQVKKTKQKNLVGLQGWLALFIVGMAISIIRILLLLISFPATFTELEGYRAQIPQYIAEISPLLWFEVIVNILMIAAIVYLIVLLAQHKALAKNVAIIVLASSAALTLIDYVWATAFFASYDVSDSSSGAVGETGRAMLAAAIWIPYFLVSKRVKATLTK